MAATERVVVLMTARQKAEVVERARVEKMSVSDYLRRRALDDDPLLGSLLAEIRASTGRAIEALDRTIDRLSRAEAWRSQREAQVRGRALAEFEDIDPEAFAALLMGEGGGVNGGSAPRG